MQSNGEKKIEDLLKANKIKYKKEVKFSDLKGLKGEYLRFDFVLYDKNNKIICCIEVDGQQHFYQVKHFQKTVFNFKRTQEWDRKKNSYCLRKKIPLIRIPYWELNKITIKSIFNNPEYRVKSIYHNDNLYREVNSK